MRNATKELILILTALVATTLLLTGCNEETRDYPTRQMPPAMMTDSEQLSFGHQLFMDKCASCHGKPSEGRSERADFFMPAAPDFTERHYQKVDPAYLYWRIEQGKNTEPYRSQGSVMPAWGAHLSEQQLWQIVAYLMTRPH